jgi:hypothetical protein
MTFHFTLPVLRGTPVSIAARPRLQTCWSRCPETGRLACHWQTRNLLHADQPAPGHDAPPGAGDLLTALLRRHRDMRTA